MSAIQLSLFDSNIYIHNNTGSTLTLLKMHGNVGTFVLEKPIHNFGRVYSDITICSMDNVTKIAEKNGKRAK